MIVRKFFVIFSILIFSKVAAATETITILWAFNIGSNQANSVRHIIEEANFQQSKYKFVLENKPGAGGTISANYVLANSNNTLVAMSSSFFIRPAFDSKNAHDLDKFQTVLVQAVGAPLVLVSKKYTSLSEFLKQKDSSVGVSGVGSISDMLANHLKGSYPSLNIVQFKGMVDATVASAGGHVDGAITFAIDSQSFIDSGDVKIIAYSGKTDISPYKNLTFSSQGIKGLDDLTANYAIFASKEMSSDKSKELHDILGKANRSLKVRDSYKKDLLTSVEINYDKSQDWYIEQRRYWQNFSNKVKSK
jgi:tripartite-type tricarboxylate transporter receptor subunit TctC